MAFESLSDKLQNIFKNLRSKGRLTEADVKASLKEVKMALLEADVSFKVVKQFMKAVQERAVGQDVLNGLNPGQMVIKIVNEEMVNLMGAETTEIALQPASEITVLMMMGLQGAGKTTTTAKIAGKLKSKGRKPLLVACDIYRPAAIQQLQINGDKQGVEVFSMGDKNKPVNIAKAAIEHEMCIRDRLLDEPFSALDTYLREKLLDQIDELLDIYHGEVILVTHNPREIYKLCSRILVMGNGGVLMEGPVSEISESSALGVLEKVYENAYTVKSNES